MTILTADWPALTLVAGLISSACLSKSHGGPPCANGTEAEPPASALGGGTRPGSVTSSSAANRPSPATPSNQNPETTEPKLSFVVRLGSEQVTLAEGDAAALRGGFQDPLVSVEVKPERAFGIAGLHFAYPRHFAFEADLSSDDSHSWVLSGNDFKIMAFRFSTLASLDAFAAQMVERFGAGTSNFPRSVRLGNTDYAGRRLTITLALHQMIMDIIELPASGGRSRFLVLQDDKQSESTEGTDARALLARTFRVVP